MSKPLVAIVGRPNVGKSTLFNKLIGRRLSIVEDTPGVTRDRIYADAEWLTHSFTLIDTGGIEPESEDIIAVQMRRQAELAIETADVIVFLVDGREGMTAADEEVAAMLRKSNKPVVLAVNKLDAPKFNDAIYEFYSLGLGDPIIISAGQGLGLGDMLDEVCAHFPPEVAEEASFRPGREQGDAASAALCAQEAAWTARGALASAEASAGGLEARSAQRGLLARLLAFRRWMARPTRCRRLRQLHSPRPCRLPNHRHRRYQTPIRFRFRSRLRCPLRLRRPCMAASPATSEGRASRTCTASCPQASRPVQ